MSKDDTPPGLLSKMVKFVRNPATSWSDLEAKESDRDEVVSKQLLKEMIERKRRNDFVRKREFDMLRKMRKREAMVGQDQTARPSFFQSSMPSKPDDRAQTLKKIDEIEAQMSMQWWKTKHGESTIDSNGSPAAANARAAAAAPPPASPPVQPPRNVIEASIPEEVQLPPGYAATVPDTLSASSRVIEEPPAPQPVLSEALEFTPTALPKKPIVASPAPNVARTFTPALRAAQPSPAAPPAAVSAPAKPAYAAALSARSSQGFAPSTAGGSGFTPTNLSAIDVSEIAHDAELEEASIGFANGDDAAAEAGLLDMLAPGGTRIANPETWMALFDLYRATDQVDKFESAALKFVERFDRSAPQWFSMPSMVKQLIAPVAKKPGSGPVADWICPSMMGIQTIATLKAALAKAAQPWRLDWSNIKGIEDAALEPLYRVFCGWSAQPVQLRFIDDARFQQLLVKSTPSGDASVNQQWWQLRMEALRVTHRPDEFELAALDFCVTYEVSPPSWETGRCEYKPMDKEGAAVAGHTIIGDVYRDSMPSNFPLVDEESNIDMLSSQFANLMTVELSGQIEGDVADMLSVLEAKLVGADIMVISCAKLIRVDFSAAGTLLNWVSARQDENRAVQFTEVNRLVAAFFNVIGITEHATVHTRRD